MGGSGLTPDSQSFKRNICRVVFPDTQGRTMHRNTLFRATQWSFFVASLLSGTLLLLPFSVLQTDRINLNQLSCQVDVSIGDKTFRIYTPSDWQAEAMAAFFCESVLTGSDYARVELSWKPREHLTPDDLLSQHFDLLFSRPRVLNGLAPDTQSLYQETLVLPAYTIYLYGHIPIYQLSSATLYKRNIGLLDDKRSQSGFLVPEIELKKRGVVLNDSETKWFNHRADLVEAFVKNQVDFIPAIGIEPELTDWPPEQRFELKTIPSAGSWYLSRALSQALRCEASQSLLERHQQSPVMGNLLIKTTMATDACS